MGIILFFANQAGASKQKAGRLSPSAQIRAADAVTYVETGTLAADTSLSGSRFAPSSPGQVQVLPSVIYEVAFTSQPLAVAPTFVNLSSRLRDEGGVDVTRGRAYEYNRTEAGTMRARLSNRDAALSPANTSSPYNPVKATRPVRAQLQYDQTYPLFYGISEGYPQSYPHLGKDAVVELAATDLFYALNQSRFTPETTTLQSVMTPSLDPFPPENIQVTSTALPMPQAVPFEITIDAGTENEETLTVTSIEDATTWATQRAQPSFAHAVGATITTEVVSFGQELSGTRIQHVLEAVGFDSNWYDLDAGQTLMAASEDLALVNPLEHINLIAEAEFGRFFVSRAGKFTFRDRHSIILDFLDPVITFAPAGKRTDGGTELGPSSAVISSNYKQVTKYTIPDGGSASGMSIYLLDGSGVGTQTLKLVLYADSAGTPGALLGVTTEITVTNNVVEGWVSAPFTSAVSLTAGTSYWLGFIAGGTDNVAAFSQDTVTGARKYSADFYGDGPTNPFGAVDGTDAFEINGITVTYAPTNVVPGRIDGALEHSEDKLFNRVRIIIADGQMVDVKDQASIDDHFERVFEKRWPYALLNDAEAAAQFVLGRSVTHSLRLPRISVRPASRPSLWPTILAREIGDRASFYYQPEGGGSAIDQEVIIEGISHNRTAVEHVVSFQLTEADPNEYWILGLAGYSELGVTTWVGF